jgi:hypothetical protein
MASRRSKAVNQVTDRDVLTAIRCFWGPAALRIGLALAAAFLMPDLGLTKQDPGGGEPQEPMQQRAGNAHKALPPIKILLPEDGAAIGRQVAVLFETSADLTRMTMSETMPVGVHLHLDIDASSMMPMYKDLIRLGRNKYLYLFDLPVDPGRHTLRVYWSGSRHETLEETEQKINVNVKP